MAVMFVMDFAGGDAAGYDAMKADMHLDDKLPPHALFHGAGPRGDGWRVIDVWETAEAFEKFAVEKIGPMSERHGFPAPEVTGYEVAELRRGGDKDVSFIQLVTIPGLDRQTFKDLDARIVPGDIPEDCVFHVNGPHGDGQYVMDAWPSKEARDRFLENNIKPGVQAAGITQMPTFEDFALHASLREPATTGAAT
jgi:hypothetical protein